MPWLTRFELISRGLIPKDGFTWSNRTSQCFWAQPAQSHANADLADLADQIVIIYADNLSDIDLRPLLDFHRSHKDPFTMVLFRAPNPRACGIAELDAVGRIVSFIEKPDQPATDLANAGLYVIDASAYREIAALRAFDLGFDVLPRFVGRMRGWVWGGYHLDIGYSLRRSSKPEQDAVRRSFGSSRSPEPANVARRSFLTVTAPSSSTSITSPTRPTSGSCLVPPRHLHDSAVPVSSVCW